MTDLSFLEDESLTDNLDDGQAKGILELLEKVANATPDQLNKAIEFAKIINTLSLEIPIDITNDLINLFKEKYEHENKKIS